MARYNFDNVHFQKVTVCGIECLFHDMRIERNTIPKGKYYYEVAGDDDSGAEPATVKYGIMVNFFGTLISDQSLPLGDDDVLWLQEGDFLWV